MLTDGTGRLQTDINITNSVGINPKTNASYSLGTILTEWGSINALSGFYSKNISIGTRSSRTMLDVGGGHISVDQDRNIYLNVSGSEYLQFDSANKRIRFNVRNTAGYGFIFADDSGNGAMYIQNPASGGYVGIGTTSPASYLHVPGNVTIGGTLFLEGFNVSQRSTSNNNTVYAGLGQKFNLTGGGLITGTFNISTNYTFQPSSAAAGNNTYEFAYDSASVCIKKSGWNGTHWYDGPC